VVTPKKKKSRATPPKAKGPSAVAQRKKKVQTNKKYPPRKKTSAKVHSQPTHFSKEGNNCNMYSISRWTRLPYWQ
jgi:hypothetical protein